MIALTHTPVKVCSFRGAKYKPSGVQRLRLCLKSLSFRQLNSPVVRLLIIVVTPSLAALGSDHRTSELYIFVINFAGITQHFRCPQVSPTTTKSFKNAELSGLRPEPRWGAQSAPQTPSSRDAAGEARCDAFGVTWKCLRGGDKSTGAEGGRKFLSTPLPL